jgi:hypothetical protein
LSEKKQTQRPDKSATRFLKPWMTKKIMQYYIFKRIIPPTKMAPYITFETSSSIKVIAGGKSGQRGASHEVCVLRH